MTDREALKLALEALEEAQAYTSSESFSPSMTNELAIRAAHLRLALEQPQTPDDLLRQSEREGWRYAKECEAEVKRLRQALEQPEQEPTVPDNMQDWANLDGDIAWHLIERHADNWADIKKMMDEFVSAKIASAQSKHECETCANKRKRLEQSGFLKSPLRAEE